MGDDLVPVAPHPSHVEAIAPGSVFTQADLDYAAGCLRWGGGMFSVTGMACRLADYARKARDECAKIADKFAADTVEDAHEDAQEHAVQAAAADEESLPKIRQNFRDRQNYWHGKRHMAVQIASVIRSQDREPEPPMSNEDAIATSLKGAQGVEP